MYYTVIKHNGHLRTLGKCKKHELQASSFALKYRFYMCKTIKHAFSTVPLRRNLTGNANANGYRTDTGRVREHERNGYRMRNGNGSEKRKKHFGMQTVIEGVLQNTC